MTDGDDTWHDDANSPIAQRNRMESETRLRQTRNVAFLTSQDCVSTLPRLYDGRVLALIDLIGTKDLIKSSLGIPPAFEHAMGLLAEFAAKGRSFGLRVDHFSDSVVFSATATQDGAMMVAEHSARLCQRLLSDECLTRGAIVAGNLVHNDLMIFGPALNEAVGLEKAKADVFRLLVTSEPRKLLNCSDLVRQSTDGTDDHELDYLSPGTRFAPEPGALLRFRAIVEQKERATTGDSLLQEQDRTEYDKRLRRYRWLLRRITEAIDERPRTQLNAAAPR